MKLLFVTQKADKADTVLGFAHSWLEEFGRQTEHVHVIAQYAGEHALPPNVTVRSLGKERGRGVPSQVVRFLSLAWSLRRDYDAVFVHMNPIWMVIGGPLWILLGKPRFLWYESRGVTWKLRLAVRMARKVFSASRFGMPLAISNGVVTGHGIDTDLFTPDGPEPRDPHLLLSVGRITEVKRFPRVLDVLESLPRDHRLLLVGEKMTGADEATYDDLLKRIEKIGSGRISIARHRSEEMPAVYRRAGLFVHAAATAGVDKAVLEAMACGCPAVSCSPAFEGILPPSLLCSPERLEDTCARVLALPQDDLETLRASLVREVHEHHSLKGLVSRLLTDMSA